MRILYLNGHPVWTYGLPWGLRQLGHDVKIVGVIEQNSLLRLMQEFRPELLITVGWINEYMKPKNPALVKKIAQEFGCTHAYWATEDITHLKRWSLRWVKAVQPDLVFTINADCIPIYRNLGIPAFHLEFGFNPSFLSAKEEQPNPRSNHDLALVANSYNIWKHPQSFRYKSVDLLVTPLLQRGYDLLLVGEGWEKAPFLRGKNSIPHLGLVPFRETFQIFKSAKIILNLQNQGSHTTQITSRTFEITGSGAFQLTARTPAVERLFTNRQHLVMSSSPAETLELVDYFLAHEKERQNIAQKGREEVLAKHTYDKRASYLVSSLVSIKVKRKKQR